MSAVELLLFLFHCDDITRHATEERIWTGSPQFLPELPQVRVLFSLLAWKVKKEKNKKQNLYNLKASGKVGNVKPQDPDDYN